ncbi:alpha/beta hydrolase [Trichocoleus sp. FACHB-591]|uniref:alpha/beta hydrolase n=1 Tax=Trichocoleus sp. FACHB-591 TaxID=2692872 RepID=UPI001683A798|nr:alpha/beta hydrolase [Trichocoleus sp. FACHB-591]MBD2095614.1 alpha/beta hydrolase [Trichocoleus sp. FACHB-591]
MTQPPEHSADLYLLDIEPIPTTEANQPPPFPAFFVGSTAPNNVEDQVQPVPDPTPHIQEIAHYLINQIKNRENPELLIAIHGYNTALGGFATTKESKPGVGVKGWYQEIRDHIAEHYLDQSNPLVLIGYRWPSEQIKGGGNDSLGSKLGYAQASLPVALKVLSALAIAIFVGLSIVSLTTNLPSTMGFEIVGASLLVLATFVFTLVFSLFLFRIVGYFRDSYRANHFGVPDLVELIRQLDKAIFELRDQLDDKELQQARVKLSFIGHSMGAFVVTNTVRILSDVFDERSVGSIEMGAKNAVPSDIGHVFSLGRLVLVAPDIPAETVISGRANFLSSSLRRFEEAYMFSNEGDMALKLASTAANYFSFSSRTREGGYRLGNVVVRSSVLSQQQPKAQELYGILNLDKNGQLGRDVEFLDYLYSLPSQSLRNRQEKILGKYQSPIANFFTVFDCTDYIDSDSPDSSAQKVGIVSHALRKQSLNFWNYISLSYDFFTGRIDTHGGYFQPAASFSKHLIYGLACLGCQPLLLNNGENTEEERAISLKNFSQKCAERGIQVLLAPERRQDVLEVELKAAATDNEELVLSKIE